LGAAIAAGADGLIIEVHTEPEKALSDGPQSLYPGQFEQLMRDLYVIGPVVGKQLDYTYLEKARMIRRSGEPGRTPVQAAYAGVPGSFSHKACLQFFGEEVALSTCSSFREVFDLVDREIATFGILPLENSLTGSFHENYDLLLDYDLKIAGEVTLRIKHNLIGHEDTTLEGIQRIYSHPQVFRQCREFLEAHPGWNRIACQDTATCVSRVKENNDPAEAAIAGDEAARLYRMVVLKEGIEMNPRNFTRFVVISKQGDLPGLKNKTSLIYSVSDRPGSLFETLRVFADHGINLVKLESRPIHDRPWEYLFYVDVDLDLSAEPNRHLREELQAKTEYFKYLGSYRKGGA
ncbi:MAG: prephenate dehydratase domain-containing protein, partial [Desulfobaccales bacterium]